MDVMKMAKANVRVLEEITTMHRTNWKYLINISMILKDTPKLYIRFESLYNEQANRNPHT